MPAIEFYRATNAGNLQPISAYIVIWIRGSKWSRLRACGAPGTRLARWWHQSHV